MLTFWSDLWVAPVAAVALLWVAAGPWALLAPVGFAAWTLVEYSAHRWLLHGRGAAARAHAAHHADEGAPVGASPLLVPAFSAAAVLAALSWSPAAMLALGVLAGYLSYFAVHSGVFHRPAGPLARAARRHAGHHLRAGGRFGVVFPLWDRLLGTEGAP